MIRAFGECELDESQFELRRAGQVVEMEPKVFDVLCHLVRHAGSVVTKANLLDTVWQDVSVTESVLPRCVATARRAIGDEARPRRFIETVHGRGYRFIAPVTERSTPDTAGSSAPFPQGPRLVGRDDVMGRLASALDAACGGDGRILLIVGEPGIGKTRAADELAHLAAGRGAAVFTGRSHEDEGAPAFWPWVQVLRAAAAGSDFSAIAELVPDLDPTASRRAPTLPEPSDPERSRFRLFDGVVSFLRRRSAESPTVLILDDLHWADEGSLQLLRFLARDLRGLRLLVVATYRDVELRRGHPLAATLADLARLPACERIPLRGLTPDDTGILVETIAGRAAPAEVLAELHDMTGGNPFFIQEITRLLPPTDETGPWSLRLPQSVRAAIGGRLDGLSTAANDLLRVASVLGHGFSATAVQKIAARAHAEVLELLDEAVAARVLEGSGARGRFAFRHALIRQTLYEEIAAAQRLRLHASAATAIEEAADGHLEPYDAELAHHLFEAAPAGDALAAVHACRRVAERAYGLLAYEESARQFTRALEALEYVRAKTGPLRGELWLGLGEALLASGAAVPASDAFLRAAGIARESDRADLLARAAIGYRGRQRGSPGDPQSRALLEEARDRVGERDPALRARLLSQLVGTPPYANSMDTRVGLAREASTLAKRSGDPTAMRDALAARLWACLGPDHVDERLEVARETLALAARTDDRHTAILGHDAELGAYLLLGDAMHADRALASYTRIADALGDPYYKFHATFCASSRALYRGEYTEAERLLHESMDTYGHAVAYAHFMFAGVMFQLQFQRDLVEPSESSILFTEMMDLPYPWERALRTTLLLRQVRSGQTEEARRAFEHLAAESFTDVVRDEHWLVTMAGFALLAIELDDRPRVQRLRDLLAPHESLFLVHDQLRSANGSAAAVLGNLAAHLGDRNAAIAHYESAMERERALGATPARLASSAGLVCVLGAGKDAAGRTRADALLTSIEEEWEGLGVRGIPPALAQARAVLGRSSKSAENP